MSTTSRVLDERDLDRVRAMVPGLAKPGEALDEAFFRLAVELAVLEHKLSLGGAAFEAKRHADWIDPVIRKHGSRGLSISWTWVEGEDLELPLPG